MKSGKRKKGPSSELASLTVSMLLSLIYFITVCWVVPVAPMIIVWMLDLPFTVFLVLWLNGLSFLGLAWFYLSKKNPK